MSHTPSGRITQSLVSRGGVKSNVGISTFHFFFKKNYDRASHVFLLIKYLKNKGGDSV